MVVMTDAFEDRYYRTADGLRLYYRDYAGPSDKVPVICLPGLTRNSRDFATLARWLSTERRVICPEFRGRGRSDYDPEWRNYHPSQYATDTWGLLDELAIERVALIGTSLGGWMAMLMSYQQEGRIVAAVMNDIGPEANPEGIARITAGAGRLDKVATFEEAVAQVKINYDIAFPDWNDEQWHTYTETTYRPTDDGGFDLNFDRNIGHAAREGVSGLTVDPWDLFDSLRNVPTLVIHGELSDILTEDIILRMQQRKPDLRVASVRNRGHAPLLDEKEAVDAIATFVQAL
jgi:pimeloyl-ACP methyl ester carboxylesterase